MLSYRAQCLLLLVASKTEKDWTTGDVKSYYVPSPNPEYCGLKEPVCVHGGGDARIFKSLVSRGLMERPRGCAGGFAITEEGHLEAEKLRLLLEIKD